MNSAWKVSDMQIMEDSVQIHMNMLEWPEDGRSNPIGRQSSIIIEREMLQRLMRWVVSNPLWIAEDEAG